MFKLTTSRIIPLVFVFGCYLLLSQPVLAATSDRKLSVPVASRVQTFTIEPKYSAYTFTWEQGNFSYSWNNINWQTADVNDDANSKEGAAAKRVSDLFFRANGEQILYIRNASAKNLQVVLIDTGSDLPAAEGFVGDTGEGGQVNLSSGASYSELNIVGRNAWGADESLMTWRPEYRKINKFIIHHTAWNNNPSNYPSTIRAIYYYHAVTMGWGDIGYNYLIDPNGTIYEGRKGGEGAIGAHAYRSNSGAIGIAFMGTFSNSLPTEAARAAFKRLLVEKALLHGINIIWGNSGKTMYGHRDMPENNTSCPGQTLYDALPALAVEAENTRQADIATSVINQKRQTMLTTLQNYTELRLKINFEGSGLSADQVRAMVPANSGIRKIMAINGNGATLYINSITNYADETFDDSFDRLKLLYLIFSLDPRVDSIDLLTIPELVEPDANANQEITSAGAARVKFSQPITKGTGNWEIRKRSDNSVFTTIPANSNQITVESGGYFVTINPDQNWDQAESYYLTICNTCIKNAANQNYPGISDASAILVSVKINWSDWQLQSGGLTRYGVAVKEFNGRLYQAMRGRSDPGDIWLRSTSDGNFDSSDARENWSKDPLTGAYSTREPNFAVFKNRLYVVVRTPEGHVATRSMSAAGEWDGWSSDGSLPTGTFIAMTNATLQSEDRLYQMMRGWADNAIYSRYSTDGKFDNSSANERWLMQRTFSTLHGVSLAFYDNKLYISIRGNSGRIWSGYSTDGYFDTEQLIPDNNFTRVTPNIAEYNGKLFQVARGDNDNRIYTRFMTPTKAWSEWKSEPGVAEAVVGIGSFSGSSRLYQVTIDGNAVIYQRTLNW